MVSCTEAGPTWSQIVPPKHFGILEVFLRMLGPTLGGMLFGSELTGYTHLMFLCGLFMLLRPYISQLEILIQRHYSKYTEQYPEWPHLSSHSFYHLHKAI